MYKTIMIAGAAGEGINTLVSFLEKTFKRLGYELYSYKNYMSRVRGGYNYTVITVSDHKVYSNPQQADIIIAFNGGAIQNAQCHLNQEGLLITSDGAANTTRLESSFDGDFKLHENHFLIHEAGLKEVAKLKPSHVMAYAGAVLRILGISEDMVELLDNKKWSDEVRTSNRNAFEYGYKEVQESLAGAQLDKAHGMDEGRLLMNGNQAIALGALASGLSFYCAYPMAPSTSIMGYLANVEKKSNIIVEQAEDEIAAIIAGIGASSNGVRAMTGTSGGGFSLMVEGLGFAAVAEIPLVIANVQRPGPATGLPTRTEQADFSFVAYASQGEFSRIILAPTDVEDCFYTTFRAFNLADKYQCPVIILSDQLLADSNQTIPVFDVKNLKVDRYLDLNPDPSYKRYDFGRIYGGRKYPGIDNENLIMTDSHVHDEYGYITEAEEPTLQLKHKFLARNQMIAQELNPPKLLIREGLKLEDAAYVLVAWGSTGGVLRDALESLGDVAVLIFSDIFPLPENVLDGYTAQGQKLVAVEANSTGQFANYLKMLTGARFDAHIQKYDGRPFTVDYVVDAMNKIRRGEK